MKFLGDNKIIKKGAIHIAPFLVIYYFFFLIPVISTVTLLSGCKHAFNSVVDFVPIHPVVIGCVSPALAALIVAVTPFCSKYYFTVCALFNPKS
mgnify:CR=1 FL=1